MRETGINPVPDDGRGASGSAPRTDARYKEETL